MPTSTSGSGELPRTPRGLRWQHRRCWRWSPGAARHSDRIRRPPPRQGGRRGGSWRASCPMPAPVVERTPPLCAGGQRDRCRCGEPTVALRPSTLAWPAPSQERPPRGRSGEVPGATSPRTTSAARPASPAYVNVKSDPSPALEGPNGPARAPRASSERGCDSSLYSALHHQGLPPLDGLLRLGGDDLDRCHRHPIARGAAPSGMDAYLRTDRRVVQGKGPPEGSVTSMTLARFAPCRRTTRQTMCCREDACDADRIGARSRPPQPRILVPPRRERRCRHWNNRRPQWHCSKG